MSLTRFQAIGRSHKLKCPLVSPSQRLLNSHSRSVRSSARSPEAIPASTQDAAGGSSSGAAAEGQAAAAGNGRTPVLQAPPRRPAPAPQDDSAKELQYELILRPPRHPSFDDEEDGPGAFDPFAVAGIDRLVAQQASKRQSPRGAADPDDRNTILAKKLTARLAKAPNLQELARATGASQQHFNAVHAATALHRLSVLVSEAPYPGALPHDRLLTLLTQIIERELPDMEPRSISTALSSYARLGVSPACMPRLHRRMLARATDFNTIELGSMFVALMKTQPPPEEALVEGLAAAAVRKLPEMTPFALTNVLVGYLRLTRRPEKEVLDNLALEIYNKLTEFLPLGIVSCLVAFARAGYNPGEGMLPAMANAAVRRLEEFPARSICDTLWAFAKLEHNPGPLLLRAVSRAMTERWREFSRQDVSTILWSFARLDECPDEKLMRVVFDDLEGSVDNFNSHDLSYLLWAFAKLKPPPSEGLLRQLAAAAIKQVPACQPQSLTMIVYAFAKLNFRPDAQLLKAAAQHLRTRLKQYNQQDIAMLVWSLSEFQHNPGEEVLKVIAMTAATVSTPKDMAMLQQAFSKLGCRLEM